MKKRIVRAFASILLLMYFCLGSLFPITLTSFAETAPPTRGDYACILQDETYFYAVPEEKRGLFLLPKTYYVQLVEYGETYCKVTYLSDDTHTKQLTGYVRTDQLTFVEYIPQRPYLYYVFDVKYQIQETDKTDSSFLTQLTVTCAYYGDYNVGTEVYCYVLRGEEFGYVPKPESLQYEDNTEYADYLRTVEETKTEPDDNSDTETPNKNGISTLQIVILAALCLLVPVLAALILKPPRRPPYDKIEP